MGRVLVPFPSVDVELAAYSCTVAEGGGLDARLVLHRDAWRLPYRALTDRGMREELAWQLWVPAQDGPRFQDLPLDTPSFGVAVAIRTTGPTFSFFGPTDDRPTRPIGELLLAAARDVLTRPAD